MNFQMLRTNPVDLSKYLPPFLTKDEVFKDTLDACTTEHEKQRLFLKELGKQFFVETATWGLADWERIVGVVPNPTDTYDQRRNRVLLYLMGTQTSTKVFMATLANRYIDGGGTSIIECNEQYMFELVTTGEITDFDGLCEAIETYKPAHLGFGITICQDIANLENGVPNFLLGFATDQSDTIDIYPGNELDLDVRGTEYYGAAYLIPLASVVAYDIVPDLTTVTATAHPEIAMAWKEDIDLYPEQEAV